MAWFHKFGEQRFQFRPTLLKAMDESLEMTMFDFCGLLRVLEKHQESHSRLPASPLP